MGRPTNTAAANSPAPRRKPSRIIEGAGWSPAGRWEREVWYATVTIAMPARARLDVPVTGAERTGIADNGEWMFFIAGD